MQKQAPTPEERIDGVFAGLSSVIALQTEADGAPDNEQIRIDDQINWEYRNMGPLLFPSLAEKFRTDSESWLPVQQGTYPYRKYMEFLLRKTPGSEPADIGRECAEAGKKTLEDPQANLVKQHPLIGTATAHLTKAALDDDKRFERQYGGWFFDVLEHVERATSALQSYKDRCMQQAGGKHVPNADQVLLGGFVEDMHAELNDFLLACTNVACCFAMHAQDEDCAVGMFLTPYSVGHGERNSVQSKIYDLLDWPVYKENWKYVKKAGVHERMAHVPTFVSVVDLHECTAFLAEYFEQIAAGKMNVRSHPQETEKHEARIWYETKNPKFNDFNLRIDKSRRGDVAIDIGGIRVNDAIRYARELGEDSKHNDMVMRYSKLINGNGSLTNVDDPRVLAVGGQQRFRYVSLMMSRLAENEKMGLMAAVILAAGKNIVSPYSDLFTYHLRGRLNTPTYRSHFPAIARHATTVMR